MHRVVENQPTQATYPTYPPSPTNIHPTITPPPTRSKGRVNAQSRSVTNSPLLEAQGVDESPESMPLEEGYSATCRARLSGGWTDGRTTRRHTGSEANRGTGLYPSGAPMPYANQNQAPTIGLDRTGPDPSSLHSHVVSLYLICLVSHPSPSCLLFRAIHGARKTAKIKGFSSCSSSGTRKPCTLNVAGASKKDI